MLRMAWQQLLWLATVIFWNSIQLVWYLRVTLVVSPPSLDFQTLFASLAPTDDNVPSVGIIYTHSWAPSYTKYYIWLYKKTRSGVNRFSKYLRCAPQEHSLANTNEFLWEYKKHSYSSALWLFNGQRHCQSQAQHSNQNERCTSPLASNNNLHYFTTIIVSSFPSTISMKTWYKIIYNILSSICCQKGEVCKKPTRADPPFEPNQ